MSQVTALRTARKPEARGSAAYFDATQQLARVGSWRWDVKQDSYQCSDELLRVFGFEPGEVEPTFDLFLEIVHADDRERMIQLQAQALRDGKSLTAEYRIITRDGEQRWIEGRAEAILDTDGTLVQMIGTAQDVTERHRREAMSTIAMYRSAIAAIAATIEARDPYTAGHQRRVSQICESIASEIGLDHDLIEGITLAATIHDIGKVAIPAEILARPGRLQPAEFELIKGHSQAGHDIVAGIKFPWPIGEMILQHHERFDGSGYPNGIEGTDLHVGARIIAVADVLEAMASHRPYRPTRGIEAALWEVKKGRGTLFDPEIVDACLGLFADGRLNLANE